MAANHRVVRTTVAVALTAAALTACKVDLGDLASAPSSGGVEPAGTAAGLVTDPEQGYDPIYRFISSAHTSLDMTMYELVDKTAEQDLAQDAERGVRVRVVLDRNREQKSNQPAFTYLTEHKVQVAWANKRYLATHQKTITVDDKTSVILTGNLTSRYYSTTRDFAVVDTTATDVAAIEKTFAADFDGSSITPPTGADLVWSPTTATPDMEAVINGAKSSLSVENEEMSSKSIENALIAAAGRGVTVEVTMTRASEWADDFDRLVKAGARVATYSASASLYIHAKVIVADAGHSGARAFLGSENFTTASLSRNRELGLTVGTPTVINALQATLAKDYAAATRWTS
ncbi:MAG TPA: phospholipase D-like domain-containing protein [Pseudonocardiaceae bacterium]|nr:phospholipase D-like domain-containing protein [Pseudonocardiaceae bacterium]